MAVSGYPNVRMARVTKRRRKVDLNVLDTLNAMLQNRLISRIQLPRHIQRPRQRGVHMRNRSRLIPSIRLARRDWERRVAPPHGMLKNLHALRPWQALAQRLGHLVQIDGFYGLVIVKICILHARL